jgi:hypothetical protein
VIDWPSQRVLHEFSPPTAIIEDFPDAGGGGLRGSRGVCFAGDLCYIASADSLYGYDDNWNLSHVVTHPLFSDLHEVAWDGSAFWVTSTGVDAVLKVSKDSELLDSFWFGGNESKAQDQLGIAPRAVDRDIDHRTTHHPMRDEHVAHPNAIQIVDGRPVVTLYYQGAVIALNPFEVLWASREFYGSHSGRVLGNQLYLAASFQQSLLAVDLSTTQQALVSVVGQQVDSRGAATKGLQAAALWIDSRSQVARRIAMRLPSWLNPRPQRNRPGWTRGLCFIDDQRALLGSSPAGIFEIDLKSLNITGRLELSTEVPHAVFAVEVDPRATSGR